jgi:Asp-tRNA(Asn)/Glu-tRNA(Gln) amidotransferase C subunit
MTEIRENPSNLVIVRRKIKKAAKAAGVDAPKKGTPEEEMLITDLTEDTGYRRNIDTVLQENKNNGVKTPSDHLSPIIVGLNSKDPRLREDKVEPSPLTPEQVADTVSSHKDKKTGMPKIPRNPDLMPWEGVSH